MKADYVHKDTLTATDYVELNKNNELLMSYNQELLKENKQLKIQISAREEVCNRLEDNWNKLKEDLIKIRKLTFTKYNKNEWENCLSFNDDILPLIEKMKELERNDE